MYEVDDIVIADTLLIDLLLEFVVGDEFEGSFRDIFVDDQVSACRGEELSGGGGCSGLLGNLILVLCLVQSKP